MNGDMRGGTAGVKQSAPSGAAGEIAKGQGIAHCSTMKAEGSHPTLSVRVKLGAESFLGPGKIELLRKIDRLGSISAAARDMGMSYRRAWLLIDSLNRLLCEPVLATELGGAKGGGARLTFTGRKLLELYLAIEVRSSQAASAELTELDRLLNGSTRQPRGD